MMVFALGVKGQINSPYEIAFKNDDGIWVSGYWRTLGSLYPNSTLNFRHVSIHAIAGDTVFARMVDTANTNNVIHPEFWVIEKMYCEPDTIFGDTISYVLPQRSDTIIDIYAYYDSFNFLYASALTYTKFLVPAYEISDTTYGAQGSTTELTLINTVPIKDPHLTNLDTGFVNSIRWYRDSTLIFVGISTDTSIIATVNGAYFAEIGITYVYNFHDVDTAYSSVFSNSINVLLDTTSNTIQCIQSVGTTIQNATNDSTSDGAIFLSINGGTPPFSFLWNNNTNQQDLVNVLPGIYSVQISSSDTACPAYYICENISTIDDTVTIIPDTVYTNIVDTCLSFNVLNYYVSNIITVGDTSTIIWIFVGANDVAIIASEYYQLTAGEHIAGISLFCAKGIDTYYYKIHIVDSTTIQSIGEISNSTKLFAYPNPVKNILFISQNTDFAIFSITGKELSRGKADYINVGSLEPGVYILRLATENGIEYLRFVKE